MILTSAMTDITYLQYKNGTILICRAEKEDDSCQDNFEGFWSGLWAKDKSKDDRMSILVGMPS